MSLKSFLTHLWKFFGNLFSRIENYMKEHVHAAVIVVENFKNLIDSPATDLITALIPGDIDDRIKDKIRSALPKVLTALQILDECSDKTGVELLECVVAKIELLSNDQSNALYHSFATLLLEKISDGNLNFSDSIAMVEWYYRNKVKQ